MVYDSVVPRGYCLEDVVIGTVDMESVCVLLKVLMDVVGRVTIDAAVFLSVSLLQYHEMVSMSTASSVG